MNNNEVFSLRRLTDEARLHVIKIFEYPELIAFSLISTKAKALVQSFEMKGYILSVTIDNSSLGVDVVYNDEAENSKFQMFHRGKYREREEPLISMDEALDFIQVSSHLYPRFNRHRHTSTWRNLGLSFTGWFKHLASIFTSSQSRFNVYTSIGEIFDTVAIRNLLPEWTSVEIREASQEYAHKIFELFSGCTRGFDLGEIKNLVKFPQKVSIQNFDMLTIAKSFTLDDALVSNALEMLIFGIRISDVNRFLKSWVRGSNPRMKKARIIVRGNIDSEKLLKGLKYQNIGEEIRRRDNRNESDEDDDDDYSEELGDSEDDLLFRKEVAIATVRGIPARVVMEERFHFCVTVYVGNCDEDEE